MVSAGAELLRVRGVLQSSQGQQLHWWGWTIKCCNCFHGQEIRNSPSRALQQEVKELNSLWEAISFCSFDSWGETDSWGIFPVSSEAWVSSCWIIFYFCFSTKCLLQQSVQSVRLQRYQVKACWLWLEYTGSDFRVYICLGSCCLGQAVNFVSIEYRYLSKGFVTEESSQ